MKDLFDIVGEDFFSLLSSANKHIYFRALMVLRTCYQNELRLRRADLVSYLVEHMMNDLLDLRDDSVSQQTGENESGETSTNEDNNGDSTFSGRAHALVRRLQATGWLDAIPDEQGLGEILLVPDHASALLDVLHSITYPEEKPYNSYVYSTYSVLRTANEERDYMYPALQSAYDNTQALLDSLRVLLHNIHKFYRGLQHRNDIRQLLSDHFDEYQVLVAVRTYHPLKTVDSVHRFRPRILSILRNWLLDSEVLTALVTSMMTHRTDLGETDARYEVVRMIQFVIDSFETMDTFLHEIDRRNSSYSRSSVERIQYLLNTDRDVRGKLLEILKRAPSLEDDTDASFVEAMSNMPLYRVNLFDSEALYKEPKRRHRGTPVPLDLVSQHQDADFQEEAQSLINRVNSLYSHKQIVEFILHQMKDAGVLPATDLQLVHLEDYLRTLVAVIIADEPNTPFQVQWDPDAGSVTIGQYTVPALTFVRKEN